MTIRVALVGCGAWGKNLLRVLLANPRAEVCAVADLDPARRAAAAILAPSTPIMASLDQAALLRPDAVVVATPPRTHAALALQALELGADVFVEKPLATCPDEAERCAAEAEARGRVAMVGHLLRYHPAVEQLLALAHGGALGRLERLEAARLSIDGDRSTSAAWTLGPHDLSVLQALDPSPICALRARAAASGDPVVIEVDLTSGVGATIALSRVGPCKERLIRVVGSEADAVFDDVRAPDRILVVRPEGSTEIPVAWREPLALELEHFLACVADRSAPRTGFDDGVRVVRALARAEKQAEAPRARLRLPRGTAAFTAAVRPLFDEPSRATSG